MRPRLLNRTADIQSAVESSDDGLQHGGEDPRRSSRTRSELERSIWVLYDRWNGGRERAFARCWEINWKRSYQIMDSFRENGDAYMAMGTIPQSLGYPVSKSRPALVTETCEV